MASLLAFILFYPPLTWAFSPPSSFWTKQFINWVILSALFYLNARHVAPRILQSENKRTNFAIWYVLVTTVFLVIARVIEINLQVIQQLALQNRGFKQKSLFGLDNHLFIVCLLVLLGSTMYAVATQWQEDAVRNEVNQKQQIASELALLKAQINPHFFFNTLNNIYSLTFSDIPLSRDALLKLSRMMRYVLYETISDKSLVSNEMDFVQDYIELMTIRVPSCTTVSFTESRPHQDYRIAPMLLLPFIENAFKYGINAVRESKINIDLSVQNGILNLHVFNDINTGLDKHGIDQKGIGLQNTRKRLDLLYPEKYSLVIDENQGNTYEITLNIELEPILS